MLFPIAEAPAASTPAGLVARTITPSSVELAADVHTSPDRFRTDPIRRGS